MVSLKELLIIAADLAQSGSRLTTNKIDDGVAALLSDIANGTATISFIEKLWDHDVDSESSILSYSPVTISHMATDAEASAIRAELGIKTLGWSDWVPAVLEIVSVLRELAPVIERLRRLPSKS